MSAKGKEPAAAAAGILYYLVCCTEVHTKYI